MNGRLLWLPQALTQAGLKVSTVGGWETRGRPTMHARGGVWHHTAARTGSNAPSLRVVIDGRSDLPGPLCHVLVGRDLTCHVIASGLCHHAGTGGWRGLTGNASVIGVECENDGVNEPWSAGMQDVMVRIAAACCDAAGHGADMWCGHKEWAPRRKVDPWGLSCDDLRRRTADLLQPPTTPEDDVSIEWATRMTMRQLLGRGPKDEVELKFHMGELARLGDAAYLRWLEVQPEAQAWARRIGAEVRSPDAT